MGLVPHPGAIEMDKRGMIPDFTELRALLINIYLEKQCCGYGLLPLQAFISLCMSLWGPWKLRSSLGEEVDLDWPIINSYNLISMVTSIVSGMGAQTVVSIKLRTLLMIKERELTPLSFPSLLSTLPLLHMDKEAIRYFVAIKWARPMGTWKANWRTEENQILGNISKLLDQTLPETS